MAICPYGARVVLSLLWSGATAETQQEIAKVLRLQDNGEATENWYERSGRPLEHNFVSTEHGEEFVVASGLWFHKDFQTKPCYSQSAQADYEAEVRNVWSRFRFKNVVQTRP